MVSFWQLAPRPISAGQTRKHKYQKSTGTNRRWRVNTYVVISRLYVYLNNFIIEMNCTRCTEMTMRAYTQRLQWSPMRETWAMTSRINILFSGNNITCLVYSAKSVDPRGQVKSSKLSDFLFFRHTSKHI